MPISAIALILIRLVALYWLLQGTIQLVSALIVSKSAGGAPYSILPYSAIPFIAGGLLFYFAPKLCRLVAKGHDENVTLEGITSHQLFTATLLGLGTWFLLSSLGRTFNWIHYFATSRPEGDIFRIQDSTSFYDLSESLLTLVAAVILMASARIWAKKLV